MYFYLTDNLKFRPCTRPSCFIITILAWHLDMGMTNLLSQLLARSQVQFLESKANNEACEV